MEPAKAQVVLAHDYLLVMRGAERTFAAMCDAYPQAPVLTLLYDRAAFAERLRGHPVSVSALGRLPVSQAGFRRLLPLYPIAARSMRPPPCDVLFASSSAFANAIPAPRGALHVCYCHNTFRYAWHEQPRALAEAPAPLRPALRALLAGMRRADRSAARRIDLFIANSRLTQARIARYYGRESQIIHPPVELERFHVGRPGERLLVVSELVAHKRVDVALQAARLAGAPIEVVGSGPAARQLAAAHPEARFLGRVGDAELAGLYAGARAVIVPSLEEFGIVAVEAQASGRPVIAADAGGARETVLDGRTGRLVTPDDPRSFARAIGELGELEFTPAAARANAERFSAEAFRKAISEAVAGALTGR